MKGIIVEDVDGKRSSIQVTSKGCDNLMELLRASGYDILAVCGGIGLCATCHVQVLEGFDQLPPAGKDELQMLDSLPDADATSRLSCQIGINEIMEGSVFRIKSEDY